MISDHDTAALQLLLDQLSGYKNRNSRVIGEQFDDLPDRSNTDFYALVQQPRCLNMIREALQEGKYNNLSQVYWDIHLTFAGVRDSCHSKSSVLWRDASKMHSVLDEIWELRSAATVRDRRLPPLESLDPAVRQATQVSVVEVDPETRQKSRPPITARNSTDSLQTNTAPPTPAARVALSPAASPSVQILRTNNGDDQPASPKAAPQPATTAQAYPTPADGVIDLPVSIPASVTSRDAKRRLTAVQDGLMAAHAGRNLPKKRKRASDEEPDPHSGWLTPRKDGHDQKLFYLDLLNRLRNEKDVESGRPLSASIIGLPARDKFPQFYQYIKDPQPPTLSSADKHIRTNKVPDPVDFDTELSTIFSNARYWQTAGANSSDGEQLPTFYGDVLGAQRLYQEMTKGVGLPSSSVWSPSSLASVQFGPGQLPAKLRRDEDGDTSWSVELPSNRLPAARKTYLEALQYKGESLAPGTFVHVYNPTAPKLPIIGQIFKCYRLNSSGDRFMTINWYYRPSQTNHTAERTFHEQEVFKTDLFVDHKVEDLIEEVCVLHIADYTRGRIQSWNEEMPVYVVEHRYNLQTCCFSRIKSWTLCRPEGVEDNLRPFTEAVPPPQRIKSPFVRNPVVQGPGRLAAPLRAEDEDQEAYYASLDTWPPGTGQVYGYGRLVQQKEVAPPAEEADQHQDEGPPLDSNRLREILEPPPDGFAAPEDDFSNNLEQLASQEAFAPLPAAIVTALRDRTRKDNDIVWFAAPPMQPPYQKKPALAPSLGHLANLAKSCGY